MLQRDAPVTTRTSNTLSMDSNWGISVVCKLEQKKRPLRHDSDVNDLDMHNNGHVNNQSNVHSLALYVPVTVSSNRGKLTTCTPA